MRSERKYCFMMNLFLCAVICLSFCYASFEDANRQSAWLDTHPSLTTQSDTLQSSHIMQSAGLQEEEAWMPSSMRAAFSAHGQMKEASIRNYCYLIFAILFKIALIPCFIFVIMGLGMCCQTPLLQLILEFIQNKDGKKRNCVTAE